MLLRSFVLGYINIMNKNAGFICLAGISLVLSGCGSDFSVGGVSLEGTGNPPDTLPGGDGMKPGLPNEYLMLSVPAPVIDQCGSLTREIRFLDFNGDPINEPKTYALGKKLTDIRNVMRVQVTITNTGSDEVIEHQPACYIPAVLYKKDSPGRLYPFGPICEKNSEVRYLPGVSKPYQVNYEPIFAMDGYWAYGEESVFIENGQKSQCAALKIDFQMRMETN